MNRNRVVRWLAALLIVGVLVEGIGPAWAQAGMKSFRKPAWRLTMQYPADWRVSEESGAVSFILDDGSGDVAVMGVDQDPAYLNTEQSLEDLFWTVLDKLDGQADNLTVEETDPRQIAGVEARSGSLAATDTASGLEMTGYVYQLVAGGKGYVILAATSSGYLDAHQPDFDAMLDSLKIGAAAPTRTPTPKKPTPRPRRATPTPTEEVAPTEEAETPAPEPSEEATTALEPAETPSSETTEAVTAATAISPSLTVTVTPAITVTTVVTVTPAVTVTAPIAATPPLTGTPMVTATAAITATPGVITGTTKAILLSAREAYELALPRALTWNTSAALVRITGDPLELSGPNAGKSPEWSFFFGTGPEEVDEGFKVRIKDGQVESAAPSDPYTWKIRVDANWLDSPELLEALRTQLGPKFKPEAWYEQTKVYSDMAVSPSSATRTSQWSILVSDRSEERWRESQTWNFEADATTGELLAAPASADEPAEKALTARQALAVAQKEAGKWKKDARLVFATGQSRPADPVHQNGQAGTWVFYFSSPSARQAYQFQVSDGRMVGKQEAEDFADYVAVTGNWPDSPDVLEEYKQRYPAYAAFSEMYPDHTWDLTLEGKSKTYNWILKAQTDGVTWEGDPLRY